MLLLFAQHTLQLQLQKWTFGVGATKRFRGCVFLFQPLILHTCGICFVQWNACSWFLNFLWLSGNSWHNATVLALENILQFTVWSANDQLMAVDVQAESNMWWHKLVAYLVHLKLIYQFDYKQLIVQCLSVGTMGGHRTTQKSGALWIRAKYEISW